MKRMMKVAALTACVGATLCFAGCGGNSPESVAIEEAKTMLKAFGSTSTCRVAKSEINGDKGVVYIDIYDNGKKDSTEKVNVVKEDGKWKVDEWKPEGK